MAAGPGMLALRETGSEEVVVWRQASTDVEPTVSMHRDWLSVVCA